jgi:hypothetical protein
MKHKPSNSSSEHQESVNELRTIFPKIKFVKGRWTKTGKRAVRLYNGKLCVSACGKLLAVDATGRQTCVCDLSQVPLIDFGSTVEARKKVQAIAPVANFERLGLKKTGAKSGQCIDSSTSSTSALSTAEAFTTTQ